MEFNIEAAVESLLRFGRSPQEREKGDDPVAMVVLLRESRVKGLDDLRDAAAVASSTISAALHDALLFQAGIWPP
jgi:hypothetical protein